MSLLNILIDKWSAGYTSPIGCSYSQLPEITALLKKNGFNCDKRKAKKRRESNKQVVIEPASSFKAFLAKILLMDNATKAYARKYLSDLNIDRLRLKSFDHNWNYLPRQDSHVGAFEIQARDISNEIDETQCLLSELLIPFRLRQLVTLRLNHIEFYRDVFVPKANYGAFMSRLLERIRQTRGRVRIGGISQEGSINGVRSDLEQEDELTVYGKAEDADGYMRIRIEVRFRNALFKNKHSFAYAIARKDLWTTRDKILALGERANVIIDHVLNFKSHVRQGKLPLLDAVFQIHESVQSRAKNRHVLRKIVTIIQERSGEVKVNSRSDPQLFKAAKQLKAESIFREISRSTYLLDCQYSAILEASPLRQAERPLSDALKDESWYSFLI